MQVPHDGLLRRVVSMPSQNRHFLLLIPPGDSDQHRANRKVYEMGPMAWAAWLSIVESRRREWRNVSGDHDMLAIAESGKERLPECVGGLPA